jgi:hypothetical protein
MWVVWNLISEHLEIVLASVQDRCTVCAECTMSSKSFWTHPKSTSVTWVIWNLISILFEIVLALVQDRCMVFDKRTIGSEIVSEIVLVLVQDRSTVFYKRTIGSEIIFDALDGTPRGRGTSGSLFWSVWR